MEKILCDIADSISFATEAPSVYGVFHIISLAISITVMLLAIRALKNSGKRTEKTLFLIASVVMIIGELYKQFVLTFNDGHFEYNMFFFPMQFCSTPIYVYPIAAAAKNEDLYNGAVLYSATYCLLAGAVVLVYPQTIFCDMAGINVQSIVHHGIMFAFGAALLVKHWGKHTLKSFGYCFGLFIFFLAIAVGINIGVGETVNMYYLNPTSAIKAPVIGTTLEFLPAPLVIFLYILVYTTGAILASGIPFRYMHNRAKNKKA